MQLHFSAISEPSQPGPKWQKLFNTHWQAYSSWYHSKGAAYQPDLKTSQDALRYYMPEMVPNYERLCQLVNADAVAARFLTGFQPPAYISACSQAVMTEGDVQLVRNYDYHPDLVEGTVLETAWNGKKVMGTSDCLAGLVDGMNEDGLVVSLTFGGRKEVGKGFGIPFILRYVLEFSSTIDEAVEKLLRVPSHMSYNVALLDKEGNFKTVQIAPDKAPLVTDERFTTNHQGKVDWYENAQFNQTVERSAFLTQLMAQPDLNANTMADAFLKFPLYNTRFSEGFGTIYTAVYRPVEGKMQIRWPNEMVEQSFDHFEDLYKLINYNQFAPAAAASIPYGIPQEGAYNWQTAANNPWVQKDWQTAAATSVVDSIELAAAPEDQEKVDTLRQNILRRGQISWEILADYWSSTGKGFMEKWQK